MGDQIEKELDRILNYYSIVLDRQAIKKDLIELIEKEKKKSYIEGAESIIYSSDYSGTIGGSSLDD